MRRSHDRRQNMYMQELDSKSLHKQYNYQNTWKKSNSLSIDNIF